MVDPPRTWASPQLWRVTDRRTFLAFRQDGRRAGRGPLTVTWLPPAASDRPAPPRVAFAIGRPAGGAVVRNRIRRRLRAALRELLVAQRLPAGSYLVGARSEVASLPWTDVLGHLQDAVAAATERSR
ncbi:MAG: ribonuclease P protein component [Acidimicrobiales bacterium]